MKKMIVDSIFDTNGLNASLPVEDSARKQRANVKTPESFLGENSSLVNLDNLMGPSHSLGSKGSCVFSIFLVLFVTVEGGCIKVCASSGK